MNAARAVSPPVAGPGESLPGFFKEHPSNLHRARWVTPATFVVQRRRRYDELGQLRSMQTVRTEKQMNESTTTADGSARCDSAWGVPPTTDRPSGLRQGLVRARSTVGAVFGALLGLAPHVLHHIGLIAGAAFVVGAGGNALFFLIGLIFSIPLLRSLYRKFSTWRAPAIAIAIFTALFSLSAFVVGPAITGGEAPDAGPQTPTQTHAGHHDG